MQKPKNPSVTYTLEIPLQSDSPNMPPQNTKTSRKTSGTGTSRSKAHRNSNQDQERELVEQEHESDLNTSGANSTIYDCVKMLTTNERSLNHEDLESFESLFSDENFQKSRKTRHYIAKHRSDQKEVSKKVSPFDRFRTRSIHVATLTCNSKVAKSGSKQDINVTKNSASKTKENTPLKSQEKSKKSSKTGTPRKSKDPKCSFQQSIYKLTRPASLPYNSHDVVSTSPSATMANLAREKSNHSKGSETITLTSRIATSPVTDLERESSQVSTPKASLKSTIRKFSPQGIKDKTNKLKTNLDPPLTEKYHIKAALTQRDSHSSVTQNLNRSLPAKSIGVTLTLSKNIQALVTPRGDHNSHKNENQKPLESIKETPKKQNEKRDTVKSETKKKKEQKEFKTTKIDLVEISLPRSSYHRRKEDKVDEYLEQIDELYDKLKKIVIEKKDRISQNGNYTQVLENFKNCINDTYNVFKTSKGE